MTMMGFRLGREGRLSRETLAALDQSQAIIEFLPDGTILRANQNFLSVMGYALGEIAGKHHRIFVDSAFVATAEYQAFWSQLASGQFSSGEFLRFGKDGRKVWILASYNPVYDKRGKIAKVVKIASDISERKRVDEAVTG